MGYTVVLRLVSPSQDSRLRGVAQDVRTGREHRFTTADELVEVLRRCAAADEDIPTRASGEPATP